MRIQEHIGNQSNLQDAVTTSNGAFLISNLSIPKEREIDISSIVMDDEAYKGQGMTTKDVMQEAGEQNVSTLRDYMTVMSNFMSDEDYATLVKEGKNPGSMQTTEMVTSLDKIKATLAQAGVEIEGFTDTLDRATLEEIFGDSMRAEISSLLKKKDLPVTKSNVESVTEALHEGTSLTKIDEETTKYIVKNNKELTIDNIYKSQFSAGGSTGKVAKGYYREEFAGYLSKKSDSLNWDTIAPQAKEIIENAGYQCTEKELEDAKWLVKEGLPLNVETFSKLQEIKGIEFPLDQIALLDQITNAMGNQKNAKNTLLTGERNIAEEAKRIKEEVNAIPEEAVNMLPKNSKITIEKLLQIIDVGEMYESENMNTTAMRQLEEIRLSMSVEANYRLLKSGFSIETESLEQVIEQLKNIEQEKIDREQFSSVQRSTYKETIEKTEALSSLPIAMLGKFVRPNFAENINIIYEEGVSLQNKYQLANEKYEPLLTEIRTDLGDSIRLAFANAETLVEELGYENTKENQKAIRILGYNQMELSAENIFKVKEADLMLTNCISKMTPEKVFQLIKDGINPLELGFEELEETLDQYEASENEKWNQYARFLQHMENKNEVSEEEKEAYIGIHRLLRQVEKTDGAVIGSLINQGAEISLKNLLTSVRTRNRDKMDYEINDEFNGVEAERSGKHTITEQIENYYNKLLVKMSDQMETKNPTTLQISFDMTLEKFAETIEDFPSIYEETEGILAREAKEMRETMQATDDMVYKNLLAYELPVTADNISALSSMMNQRGSMYRNLSKMEKELEENDSTSDFEETLQQITDSFTDQEETMQAYESLPLLMKKITAKAMEIPEIGKIDQKAISLLYKQVSLTTNLAKEENYEVPLMIGEELTSINLKIIHQSQEKGKLYISTNTEFYGELIGEFSITQEEMKGYLMGEKEDAKEALSKMAASMEFTLSEDGKSKVEIDVISSNNMQKNMLLDQVPEDKEQKTVSTKEIYRMAKTFLGMMQKQW